MKSFPRFLYSLIFLSTLFVFSNCERTIFVDATPDVVTPTTLEFIRNTPGIKDDLTEFSALISEFGLEDKLKGSGPFTIFVPTNEAFGFLVEDNPDWNSFEDIPQATLQEILDYHFVSDQKVILQDTFIGFVNTSKTTDFDAFASLLVKSEGSIRLNGERSVTLQDVETQNGVVQVLQEVILPPTVYDLVEADSRLSTLTKLLERDDFSTDFTEVLNGTGPFTIFAPTDSAFLDYLLIEGISSVDAIATADLEQILLNHVSNVDNLRQTDLTTIGNKIQTLNGSTLEIVALAGNNLLGISGSNSPAKYIDNNGQAINGVVHLVDNILLP